MVTCALWDIDSRESDKRPLGPSALKTMHIDELRREVVCSTQQKIHQLSHKNRAINSNEFHDN